MAESLLHPTFNRLPKFAQPSFKEMICAFNQHKFLRVRHRCDQSLQLRPRTKRISRPADKQLGFNAFAQEIKFINSRLFRVGSHWNRRRSHSNQRFHARIRARGSQSNRRAERESRKHQRQVKLRVQPVESGPNIFDFAIAVIVFAMAQSGAAKVEPQHGKTKTVQRLHSVEHDLVMQRPAEQRMRMADDRRVSRVFGACVEQRFQSSRWAFEKERFDGRILGDHSIQIT